MNYIKNFQDISANDLNLVGGKGLSLGLMTVAGIPVPPGFVVTTDLFRKFGTRSEVGADDQDQVYAAFDKLGATRVAVRSSATAEDSKTASWAGQFESYLNVRREDLIQRIQDCWQSKSGGHDYAAIQNIPKEQLVMGVVIQTMVDSEVSGVAFSVNPISKNTDEIMVEAIYGLGELLVQGMITPDNYVVDKHSFEVTEKITKIKPNMLVYRNNENVEEPVPESQRSESCLTDEQIVGISQIIVNIEQFYDKPQDIEWALEGSQFYIVQSRPITTI